MRPTDAPERPTIPELPPTRPEDVEDDPWQIAHELIAALFPAACDPDFEPAGDAEVALRAVHDECVAGGAYCDGTAVD